MTEKNHIVSHIYKLLPFKFYSMTAQKTKTSHTKAPSKKRKATSFDFNSTTPVNLLPMFDRVAFCPGAPKKYKKTFTFDSVTPRRLDLQYE